MNEPLKDIREKCEQYWNAHGVNIVDADKMVDTDDHIPDAGRMVPGGVVPTRYVPRGRMKPMHYPDERKDGAE